MLILPKLDYLATLRGHVKSVNAIAFSPDAKRLASGSMDRTTRIWDLDSKQTLYVMKRHRNAVESIAYSPDGRFVVSGGFDHKVYLWNAMTGNLAITIRHFDSLVASVAYSNDGKKIAAGAGDIIRLFDGYWGTVIWTFEGHESWITSVAFSESGVFLASGCMDGIIRIWDSGTISKFDPLFQLETNKIPVHSVLFSEDENMIVGGYEDGFIRIWDTRSKRITKEFKAHDLRVRIIAWNKLHDILLTCSDDTCAKVWDLNKSSCMGVITNHRSKIHAGSISLDGSIVAVASDENDISLWRVNQG